MRKLILCSILLSMTGCGDQLDLRTLKVNREGNALLEKQNYQGANEKYIEALRFNPYLSRVHSNLGLSFEGLQQAEKAQQSYAEAGRLAEASKDANMLFVARFNEAQLLGKAKKVDEALELYQKALEIVPSSKEVKTNIELLIQTQQGGGGQGDNKDKKDQQQGKDQQQQQQQDQKGDKDQNKDQKDQDGKDGKDQKEKQQYQNSAKYKPRPFAGKELSEGDVKKILGEIKQQEGKIRADYNRKETKEQPRDKDW
ncbi:tetratricopeptide repeat protein [Bdellovibrio sp. KM01]|uniref:tetratricopeptide repeat protein n=1 Tax=Bdellovibrio sp. KM01 TaxID=2748865 RepID=UPI0015E9CE73|nr:tetratricopeptide repeat protein [Bdellovibrio sp. KM01]QLY26450.1 tetratricopeptide repeat protein [Bdellovibrio sp. KM01]